jgi:prepilin-type N-terminal cleavage/methylation domain-containing protein
MPAQQHRSPGFTIVELIAVLAIIALLIALIFITFRAVRSSASRTETLNSLKSVIRGYITYQGDHRGRLMPGFVDQQVLDQFDASGKSLDGFDLAGNRTTTCNDAGSVCDASSYVWRLMPYLDNGWDVFVTDYNSNKLKQHFKQQIDAGRYGFGSGYWPVNGLNGTHVNIGTMPAFGLNSIYMGGDNFHGSSATRAQNPWNPTNPGQVLAATNGSAVRNPAQLITFAPTKYRQERAISQEDGTISNPPVGNLRYGYCELRAPWVYSAQANDYVLQWRGQAGMVGEAEVNTNEFGNGGGVPVGRASADKVPVAHFDGSTVVEDFNTIAGPIDMPSGVQRDYALQQVMSRWSPFVTAPVSVKE